jgi:O-antigen/teichoic acid export membrane protein
MSRTQRFLGGVFLGYAQQILVTLVGLWLTPFLLHRIGQHDYGLWLVGLQILTWLTLMDFGIVALLPRETAYAIGRAPSIQDAHDLPGVIGQAWRVVLWQWPLVAIAAVGLWLSVPHTAQAIRGPIALVVGAFTLAFPLRICRAVLEGLQDLSFLGRAQIFSWAVGTVLTVSLVLAKFQLYALAAGWVATQVTLAITCFLRLKIEYPGVLPNKAAHIPRSQLSSYLGRGFWMSVGQIAQVLLDGSDLLVIGKTLGSTSVVPYSCSGKLITVLANQPTMLMHAASPGLSAIKSSGDRERAFRVAVNLTQGMLILSGAVVCVVLSVNRGFVGWWVGSQLFAGMAVTVVLAVAMLLRHWNITAVYSIFCFGYERRLSITTLVDGVVSVLASFLLVRSFGVIGAPLGSIFGVCTVSLPSNLWALSHESGKSFSAALFPLWPWFWRFAILASGCGVLQHFWHPHNPVTLGITVLFTGSLYTLLMIPMLMGSPLQKYLPGRIVQIWEKITNAAGRSSAASVEEEVVDAVEVVEER